MGKPDEEQVDQFLIYAGYGEVMHRLQVLELSLWQLQTRGIRPGATAEQAMSKVEKWNATTLGALMRGMKCQPHWPDGLVDRLLKAVDLRNYLAHHYLREYFVVVPSHINRERAAQELANISVFLKALVSDLDVHTLSLGIPIDDREVSDKTRAEIDGLRPAEWLGIPSLDTKTTN